MNFPKIFYSIIQNDSDIVMWNFKMICMDLKQDIIRKIGQSFVGDKDVFFHSFLIPVLDNEMFNPPWNKLIKRQMLIDNNIRFDERFSIYEDILFSYKIMQKAEKISVNDNVYYDYIIKESGSLLTKFHSECFKAIMEIYDNSIKYAEMFAENNVQIERFKQQAVYLTKGYIKQVCMNKELSYQQKKEYLSEIANNNTFIIIYQNVMNEVKSLPAKFMIKNKMYKCLILYYHGLEMIR